MFVGDISHGILQPFAKQYPIHNKLAIIDTYQSIRNRNNGNRLNIKLNTEEKTLPNIILIVLESFVSENCNFLNPAQKQTITPNLNKLVKNGILFERCFANGIRSAYGIGSILCSWPTLPGKPIIKQVEASFENNIGAEPIHIMRDLGYKQIFLYGGDAGFDNMKGFAMANGFNQVIDWEDGFFGDVIDIYDNKRIPLSKLQRDKKKDGELYPYYGAAKIMDHINDYIFDGEYILIAEDGTVRTDEGFPVLQYATGKFWVNNHTHVIKAKAPYTDFFLLNYLSKKNIDEIVTGAVQPKINQTNLKSLDFE